MLAHNATVLKIPFDPTVLYATEDSNYMAWFSGLVDKVGETRREADAKAKADANARR